MGSPFESKRANDSVPVPQARGPLKGGSFAPPLTDAKINQYRGIINSHEPGPLKDAMQTLLACCEKWWDLPEAAGTAAWAHPSGKGQVVTLQDDHAAELFGLIPWEHELNAMQSLFDSIDPVAKRDLRNCAFHLLWYVKELEMDREPLTNDKL